MIGPQSPASHIIHPLKWWKLITSSPANKCRWVSKPGEASVDPHAVIIHSANRRADYVKASRRRWPRAAIVALSYNSEWTKPGYRHRPTVLDAFKSCDLVFGWLDEPTTVLPPHIASKWHNLHKLIDAQTFYSCTDPRDIDIFIPRGFNNSNWYWPSERDEAIELARKQFTRTLVVVSAEGDLTELQMADYYRRSKIAVCLREEAHPGYSTVEACLCGCIPVASKCPGVALRLGGRGKAFGFLVTRDPQHISKAFVDGIRMWEEDNPWWVDLNAEMFSMHTLQIEGPRVMESIRQAVSKRFGGCH